MIARIPAPKIRRAAAGLLLLALSAGCAVGPDYERPDVTAAPPAYAAAPASAPADSAVVPSAWWLDFGVPEIDALVREALAANPDVAAAAARVMEARARLQGARSTRLPSVEIGGTASRSKMTLSRFGGRGSIYNNFFSATAGAAYELDLWGRLSRTRQAAWASLLAGEADRRTVTQALIAEVVRAWLGIAEGADQLSLSESTEATYERNLAMVEDRYVRGVVSSLDLHLARQNLASARARRAQAVQDLSAARQRLELLLGRYPAGAAIPAAGGLAALPALPAVPPGLPSSLLERRPDIVAAEMRLVAATASIGAAKAELFPRLALTGEAGYNSSLLEDLLEDASSIWSLAGSLAMPLLNRGARTAEVAGARARAEAARADYVKTVLDGFREVEAALVADRVQGERRAALRESAEHARRSLAVAEDRYRQGLDNFLFVLDSQRRLFQAESDLLRTERSWREARVGLIAALGGPWDEIEGSRDPDATEANEAAVSGGRQ